MISTVFGEAEVVPQTLDFARDEAPLPQFMNGMFSYSLWWVIIHRDWYLFHGNMDYLQKQRDYLLALLDLMNGYDESNLPAGFLDWPTSPHEEAVQSGLCALVSMAFRAGGQLCRALNEDSTRLLCEAAATRWAERNVFHCGIKTTAALMALAGMLPAGKANSEVLASDPLRDISTFYGYYVLQARAQAADHQGCLDVIRRYWGAMLDFGATTFWEDFNLDWTHNAARIDELVPPGKCDIHADFGVYCYKGLRHSLCHGWAAGPSAWLSEHVLGFRPLAPGCRQILIDPHLADLQWARGSFPAPEGVVRVSHKRLENGRIETEVSAPETVKVVTNCP